LFCLLPASFQGNPQLLQGSEGAGRRMLSAAADMQHTQQAANTHPRHLHAANIIPDIPEDVAVKESVIPTTSPLLTLNDMLCAVEDYSPTGLTGMVMPTAAEFKNAGVEATAASGKPIKCDPLPTVGTFQHGNVVFKPVVIPVVFHCE
jgi:hypothetical protein